MKASGSDLVLFVLDQDINKYEHFLIKELSNLGKKIIIVLNKCDLRSDQDNNTIIKNIRAVTSTKKNNISVVKAVAVRRSSSKDNSLDLNLIPEVTDLFKEIINTLDECGEELLADNILFRSNKLGIKSKKLISEQRYISANKIINKYIWITGSVILVNPLPAIDFLTATSVNVQMIIELSKIYEVKLTKKEAIELSKTLISALAKLGILKAGLSIVSASLTTSLPTMLISKSIQSVTAGLLIKIVGQSLIEYFRNGQDWGDGGVQEIVNKFFKLNKKEEILKQFVKEAISKIELNKRYKNDKKLPPFLK